MWFYPWKPAFHRISCSKSTACPWKPTISRTNCISRVNGFRNWCFIIETTTKKHGKAMSRKAFFAAHCTHRFDQLHWGRLSEKSNIPQWESRIRFRPCIGVRSVSVSRGLFGQSGGKRPRVNQDQDNATRIKSRMQNERISLLLILVDPESTVCP